MKRRIILSPLLATMVLAAVSGCLGINAGILDTTNKSTSDVTRGALRVAVHFDPKRSTQYTTSDVDHVSVVVSAGNLSQTVTIAKDALTSGAGSANFESLAANIWTLGAIAYNAASQSIGGSLPIQVPVVANQTATASVTMELSPNVVIPSPLPAPTDAPQALSLSVNIQDSQSVTLPVGGVVSTLAGSTVGRQDGTGAVAQFNYPRGIAVDASGSIYVADTGNHIIRKITPSGKVTTLAGNGTVGVADGTGSGASFTSPSSLAVDSRGNIYVASTSGPRIRKITPAGVVSTLNTPWQVSSLVVDAADTLYLGTPYGIVRKTETTESIVAGSDNYLQGYVDGTGSNAMFGTVYGLALDATGNLFATANSRVRKVVPGGVVTTLVGGGSSSFDSTGVGVALNVPCGIAIDASGRLFVGESGRVRMITPSGAAITIAGYTSGGFADGTGSSARFSASWLGVALDRAGRIYVADAENNRIRLIR